MGVDIHFFTLLTMVASGVFVMAMFDTYKILFRPVTYWNKVIVDTLFMLTQSCLVYYFLFLTNGGVIRFYLFLAVLLGISFYYAILQPIYIELLNILICVVARTYLFLKRLTNSLIIKPVTWIVETIFAIAIAILLFIWKVILGILKIVKAILKPFIPTIVQKYLMILLTKCSKILDKFISVFVRLWEKWRQKDGEGKSKES